MAGDSLGVLEVLHFDMKAEMKAFNDLPRFQSFGRRFYG